jgi:type II secretory pathway component PulF
MPQFSYKAKSEDGNVVSGTLQAETEKNAVDSLGRMGMFPMDVSVEGKLFRMRPPKESPERFGKVISRFLPGNWEIC